MSETDNLIDTMAKMIVGTVDERLSSADFDKSSQGVVTAKAGDTYTIAVFGGNYNITTDQTFVVGQKVLVTAPQGNMKNLTVSPGNIGTMKTVRSGVQDVDNRVSDIEGDFNFAYNIVKNQIDGQFSIWYNLGSPSMTTYPANQWTTNDAKHGHIEDYYFDTKDGVAWKFVYQNNTYQWIKVTDSTITATLLRSSQAQDTADGKRRIFYNNPSPPYDVGDMWCKTIEKGDAEANANAALIGTKGENYICKVKRSITESFHNSDWIKSSKYTDDTKANAVEKNLNDFKNGEFTNLREEYDTNFTVDNKSITGVASSILYGTKLNVGGQPTETAIASNTSQIKVLNKNINLKVSYKDLTGDDNNKNVKQSVIDMTKEQIKQSVTDGDVHSAITETANNIKSEVVGKDQFTGKNLISTINQTAEAVTINASKINLDGDVLAINTDKITIKGNAITTDKLAAGAVMNEVKTFAVNQPNSGGEISFDDIGYSELLLVFRGWYEQDVRKRERGTHTSWGTNSDGEPQEF